jgi:hypothetical protein
MTINPGDGVFIADIFGFILSLLFAPFLTFWLSAVKNRAAVVIGSIVGGVLGFFIIYAWAGPLFTGKDLTNVQPAAVFFGSLLFCTIMGVIGGMIVDLLVARASSRDYRRPAHE